MRIISIVIGLFSCFFSFAYADNSQNQENQPHIIVYQFAVYLLKDCVKNPKKTALKLANAKLSDFKEIKELSDPPPQPVFNVMVVDDVKRQYAAPDLESIGYFSKGISHDEAISLQSSNKVIIVNFAYPIEYTFSAMKQALRYVEQLASDCHGFIWDEETRQIFSPSAWNKIRLSNSNEPVPNMVDHTVIHSYKTTEYVRAITLGMGKFGLPDVVVNNFSWSDNRYIGNLINVVAQSLIEGNQIDDKGNLYIDIHAIKNKAFRTGIEPTLRENAAPNISIHLIPAKREDGDPNNALLQIDFRSWPGKSLQEKQNALTSILFGWEDEIFYVKNNDEILKASENARKKLPALRKAFNSGLQPGEFIELKAPFKTPDGGNEWMWVEVLNWDSTSIKGLLKNEPFNIPNLKAGATVVVDQADIFDYIRKFPGGKVEGNETSELIRRYQAYSQKNKN